MEAVSITCCTIALKKKDNRLNLLFPELVVFALFDRQVPTVKRQAMASQLHSCQGLWELGELAVPFAE